MKPFVPVILCILLCLCSKLSYAQDIAFMTGNWQGKAFLPADTTQVYLLSLDIDKIKGNRFEGLLKTIKPSDTSLRFDARVLGMVSKKNFDMVRTKVVYVKSPKETSWKVSCTDCKPPKWTLSIESEDFVIRSVVRNCSPDCDWVTEYRKPVSAFTDKDKPALFALAGATYTPNSIAAAPVDNPPESVVTTADQQTTAQNNILVSTDAGNLPDATTSRLALPPAGNIAPVINRFLFANAIVKPANLVNKPSVTINTTPPEIPRINMAPAGNITVVRSTGTATIAITSKNISAQTPGLQVNTTPPEQNRIVFPPPGNIAARNNKPGSLIYRRTYRGLPRVAPGYRVPAAPLQLPDAAAIAAVPVVVTPDRTVQVAPVLKAPPALPAEYNSRKQEVVTAIRVNTDSVTIRLYDNGVVDGDIVSVIYNDKVVIDRLSLTTKTIELNIPVSRSGINHLVFHAHNLGELPPNTAKLEIIYGGRKDELTVSSNLTVSSTINILYTEPVNAGR